MYPRYSRVPSATICQPSSRPSTPSSSLPGQRSTNVLVVLSTSNDAISYEEALRIIALLAYRRMGSYSRKLTIQSI